VLPAVLELVSRNETEPRAEAISELAKACLRRADPVTGDADSTYRKMVSLYEFIEKRTEPAVVRVFNPTEGSCGYGTDGTVIEINTEDGPFLFDSVSAELAERNLSVARAEHPVVGTIRDADGQLESIGPGRKAQHRESIQHFELADRLDDEAMADVERGVRSILDGARQVVLDFEPMKERIDRMISLAKQAAGHYSDEDIDETISFLKWLRDGNYIFLGYREYRLLDSDGERAVQAVEGSGLGLLANVEDSAVSSPVALSTFPRERAERFENGPLITITKTNQRSTVQRRDKMDYIGLRLVAGDGSTTGEIRLIGLFTTKARFEPAFSTPILRRKIEAIVESEDLIEGSRDHKAAIQIFDGFSKHDLFASPTDELRSEIMGLLRTARGQGVRLTVREDSLGRSVFVLVSLPHETFNPLLRAQLQALFMERLGGSAVDYHLNLTEANAAQIHFTVWLDDGVAVDVPFSELEEATLALTRSWRDRIEEELSTRRPDAEALADKWCENLPDYFRTSTPVSVAATDIEMLERLVQSEQSFVVGVQNEPAGTHGEHLTRITLYRADGKRPLTELMPALEDFGFEVVEEVPTRVDGLDEHFIHDFGVRIPGAGALDIEESGERVEAALQAIWEGGSDSDTLNGLIVRAALSHQQVQILRAYRTYWRRVRSVFTVGYVNQSLVRQADLARLLIQLFEARFDPAEHADEAAIREQILGRLEDVPSIDDDRIIRTFMTLIDATVRTNAYQPNRQVLSFKITSALVPDMPFPKPMVEVFVLGSGVEGIHLRGGPVARGGIRASDRREDYRLEVLGLMKAQMTKNAVIVPDGAKGGFVLRSVPADPIDHRAEIERQYEQFIRGLLDLTDSIEAGVITHPIQTRIHDGEDAYLVVAADKGTASFSDLANSIAADYGFWLGDAFASGGSAGYDHKALGITARGAWESARRHFGEAGINADTDEITVAGIGDMSGDVFGNGLLLSENVRLVAAFDHRHIFVDPNPTPGAAHAERKRLFDLSRSSWDDYDKDLISDGGGVWPRTKKKIRLSSQAQAVLGVEEAEYTPNELICAILKAPVNLLWNGGIGTYVKGQLETNDQVSDRSNDAVRIDGHELRADVVVEGGNLGLTQRARIEYALTGGRINTDFIDNSGGVHCSDREVNLKILLGLAAEAGELPRNERDALIAAVAPEVVSAVLYDSYEQAQILAQEHLSSAPRLDAYEELMQSLEADGLLTRRMEALPSTDDIKDRSRAGHGLTRPELAVLVSYAKRSIRESLESSSLPDDPYLERDLRGYFPAPVVDRFDHVIPKHPLRRRLVATMLANDIVNANGATYVSRLCARTGAEPAEVVKAYRIAKEVTRATERWEAIEALFGQVPLTTWHELMDGADGLVSVLTRRYLAQVPERMLMEDVIGPSVERFRDLERIITEGGATEWRLRRQKHIEDLVTEGVPPEVASWHVYVPVLTHASGAIRLSEQFDRSAFETLEVMLGVGQAVALDRLEEATAEFRPKTSWDRWAIQTVQDDVLALRQRLAAAVFFEADNGASVDHYLVSHAHQVARIVRVMRTFESGSPDDLAPLVVAVRQVRTLLA